MQKFLAVLAIVAEATDKSLAGETIGKPILNAVFHGFTIF